MLVDLKKWIPSKSKFTETITDANPHKSTLGLLSKSDQSSAEEMVVKALNLSHDAGKLIEAADLLEEALNKSPGMKAQYEYQLKLWRRGLTI